MQEKITVCLPVYNGADTVLQTIHSVLNQTFIDFEFIIVDNVSTDATFDIISSVKDERIKIYVNEENKGCGGNLEECKKRATGDILFYICADDVVDRDALKKIHSAFCISEDISMVIRPYYWFEEDVSKPVRITRQFSEEQIVSINDSYDKIVDVIALADQISGVAFRKKYMNFQFKNGYFMEMPSMVASMLKNHKTVILKDNIVAVRIGASGALNPIVYKKSPLMSWYNLITTTYSEKKFSGLKKHLIHNFIAKNYIGLVQIKNFGSYTALFKEIVYMVKLRWKNILTFQFWIFSVGTMIIPRFILRKLVVFYKNKINSTLLKNIKPIKIV